MFLFFFSFHLFCIHYFLLFFYSQFLYLMTPCTLFKSPQLLRPHRFNISSWVINHVQIDRINTNQWTWWATWAIIAAAAKSRSGRKKSWRSLERLLWKLYKFTSFGLLNFIYTKSAPMGWSEARQSCFITGRYAEHWCDCNLAAKIKGATWAVWLVTGFDRKYYSI